MTAVLHAEWTKFRTVRGWVIGLLVAAGVTMALGARARHDRLVQRLRVRADARAGPAAR